MSNVKTWANPLLVENYLVSIPGGKKNHVAWRDIGSFGSSEGIRHRIRPPILLSGTGFKSIRRSAYHGGGGKECNRGFYYHKGTAYFCFGGQNAIKTTVSSSGSAALTKALANFGENDFGEALAELKQTTNMILKRIFQLVKFAKDVRSGKWGKSPHRPSKKARETPGDKRLADNFLEFQYGWKPVVSDIYNLVEAFADGLTERGSKVGKRSSHRTSDSTGNSATAKAGVSGIVKNPVLYDLNRFGLANPALLAWELVPLSFVLDWFIPLSTTLGSLTGTAGMEQVSSWQTTHTSYKHLIRGATCNDSTYLYDHQEDWVRSVSSLIYPTFFLKGSSLNAGQVASAVALLRQRI